jgi:WD40 repeat protein
MTQTENGQSWFSLRALLMFVAFVAILISFVVALISQSRDLPGWICSLSYSPDGRHLAVGTETWWKISISTPPPRGGQTVVRQFVQLLDVETGKRWIVFQGAPTPKLCTESEIASAGPCVRFSPAGHFGVAAWRSKHVRLYDPETNRVVQQWAARDDDQGETTLAFSRDGSLVATGGLRAVEVRNLTTGKTRTHDVTDGRVLALAISPDTCNLAVMDDAGRVAVYDVLSGERRQGLNVKAGEASRSAIAFSSKGTMLAASSNSPPGVQVWLVETGESLYFHPCERTPVALAFSHDNREIAFSYGLNGMTVWNPALGQAATVSQDGQQEGIYAIVYSPDGSQLASGDVNGNVTIWDAGTLRKVECFNVRKKQHLLGVPWAAPMIALVVWLLAAGWLRRSHQKSRAACSLDRDGNESVSKEKAE